MQRVLMLGATSAIAAEIAALHAARGDRLVLVGRNPDKLRAIEARLGDSVVQCIRADLDACDANAARVEEAWRAFGSRSTVPAGIDVCWIAQGLLGDQLASERDYAEAERILRTNFLGVMSLLIPLANLMEGQGSGRIAVLSSVAAERGRPRNFTYGAAKAALNVYLQGQRSRLRPAGVRVHTIKLGPVETPMTVDHEKNPLFARPEEVARAALHAMEADKAEAYVPWYWWPIMQTVRHLPEPVFQRARFLSGR